MRFARFWCVRPLHCWPASTNIRAGSAAETGLVRWIALILVGLCIVLAAKTIKALDDLKRIPVIRWHPYRLQIVLAPGKPAPLWARPNAPWKFAG